MCAVSMISDHYMNKWPDPIYQPNRIPARFISESEWNEYQELKKKAVEYDKRTGQPDCVKPEVDEWEKKIVDVLIKRGILLDRSNDI